MTVSSAVDAVRSMTRVVFHAALIVSMAAAVAGAALLWLGPPTRAREYRQNEIARFAPTPGHGIGQLVGESGLLILVAYAGRRWLRVRL